MSSNLRSVNVFTSKKCPNADIMSVHRQRSWTNIHPTLAERLVPSGVSQGCDLWHQALILNQHETLTQCCVNVGPPSTTLTQHYSSIGSASRVCWDSHVWLVPGQIINLVLIIKYPPPPPAGCRTHRPCPRVKILSASRPPPPPHTPVWFWPPLNYSAVQIYIYLTLQKNLNVHAFFVILSAWWYDMHII